MQILFSFDLCTSWKISLLQLLLHSTKHAIVSKNVCIIFTKTKIRTMSVMSKSEKIHLHSYIQPDHKIIFVVLDYWYKTFSFAFSQVGIWFHQLKIRMKKSFQNLNNIQPLDSSLKLGNELKIVLSYYIVIHYNYTFDLTYFSI